jgi:hypothetical protein
MVGNATKSPATSQIKKTKINHPPEAFDQNIIIGNDGVQKSRSEGE